jgi:hypothetical protein
MQNEVSSYKKYDFSVLSSALEESKKNLENIWQDSLRRVSISQQEMVKKLKIIATRCKNTEQKITELEMKKEILNEEIECLQHKSSTQEQFFCDARQLLGSNVHNLHETVSALKKQIATSEDLYNCFETTSKLNILKKENCIRFDFSCITQLNQNKHFVELSRENQVYVLISCVPLINGIEELLVSLNRTQDLTFFLKTVRSKFKLLYN